MSEKPPLIRSCESDWFTVQECYLIQIKRLIAQYNAPCIVAGDLFDKWNSSPYLINFLIRTMPVVYAIPGNHDAPLHSYDDMHKSAYQTLVAAGVVRDLSNDTPTCIDGLRIYAFPFGFEVRHCLDSPPLEGLNLAVIHSYIWTAKTGFPGAPEQNRLSEWQQRLQGYHAAAFGDNHQGFLATKGDCKVINCGTLMRRKADERDYRPGVGLLYASGKIERHYLDCSQDRFLAPEVTPLIQSHPDLEDFLEGLGDLEDVAVDFADAVQRFMMAHDLRPGVKDKLLKLLEDKK